MKIPLCLLLAAVAPFALSQNLAPELAPMAAKYKLDVATLEAQRAAALAQAQNPYVAALGVAERSATTSGNVATVSMIATERATLNSGLMAPGFPPGMPKELQIPRKTYLDALARIRTAEAPRRQALDGFYLRALTNLSAKVPKETELARQIEAEKQKLIANAPSTSSGKANSKNLAVNGTFDLVNAAGNPIAWVAAEGFKVARDGTNSVLHASIKMPGWHIVSQDIVIPPKERSVTLKGRVRGTIVSRDPGKVAGSPGVFVCVTWVDRQGKESTNWLSTDAGDGGDWRQVNTTTAIPKDMEAVRVVLMLKFATGEFDFDDIEVEFR